MKVTKNYDSRHRRLRRKMECKTLPLREEDREKCYARIMAEYGARAVKKDPGRRQRFQELSERAMEMARELLLDLTIQEGQKNTGVIECAAAQASMDESCSAAARRTMAELFQTADSIWMESETGKCRLTFVYKLWEEEKTP